MRAVRVSLLLSIALAVFCWSGPAHAQRRYRPRRPTISPYLDLLREPTGPLPNYYQFVRPKLDTQGAFRRQQSSIAALQQRLRQVQGTAQAETGVSSSFRTSTPYFRNSAAFYGTRRTAASLGGRGRRGRRGP